MTYSTALIERKQNREGIFIKTNQTFFTVFLFLIYINRNDELSNLFFFSILFTLRESGCSYEQQDTPISGSCVHKSMPRARM